MESLSNRTEPFEKYAHSLWDVCIIGGGLAGLTTAIQLGNAGAKVVVVEKKRHPRPKVCGACLNLRAVDAMKQIGLKPVLERCGAVELHQVDIGIGARSVVLDLPGGVAVTRSRLDLELANNCRAAGVELIENTVASLRQVNTSEPFRTVCLKQAKSSCDIQARVVIVAAGLGGVATESEPWRTTVDANSHVGIGASWRCHDSAVKAGTIYLRASEAGYVGLVVAEDEMINLAAAISPKHLSLSSPEQVIRRILSENQFSLDAPWHNLQWMGTLPLTRQAESTADYRLLTIGDAAGYVEPFTGEGMAWALASSRSVSQIAAEGVATWSPELEQRWSSCYRELVGKRQWSCRGLAWLLRHQTLASCVLGLVNTFPFLGRSFVRDINRLDR